MLDFRNRTKTPASMAMLFSRIRLAAHLTSTAKTSESVLYMRGVEGREGEESDEKTVGCVNNNRAMLVF